MKKTILLFGSALAFNAVMAQTNLGFETWAPTVVSSNDPTGWSTLNVDNFGGPANTVQLTVNPGQGSTSASMTTAAGFAAVVGIDTLPGLVSMGTANILIDGVFGLPFTQRIGGVQLMYRANPMPGDTGVILLQLTRWNTITSNTDLIGQGIFYTSTNVTNWTTVSIPMYYQSNATPDTLQVIGASSRGVFLGSPASIPGSTLDMDAVQFINLMAAEQHLDACSSCNGAAQAIPLGGVPPYTFNWSNGQTDSIATGLCAGSYSCTITDNNGDTASTSLIINSQPGITTGSTTTDAVCNGSCDGMATATVSGGTTPYTYLWSSGGTAQTEVGLCAGNYTVTITDAGGCSGIEAVSVSEPSAISANTTAVDANCNGSCDGSATVAPSGGTAPYTYTWASGATTTTATGLCAGSEAVTITDANACILSDSATIAEPSAIAITDTSTAESASGAGDGIASVTVSGGTTPYSYQWDDPSNQTTGTATGLNAGTYTCVVTDGNGCSDSVTVNVVISGITVFAMNDVRVYPVPAGDHLVIDQALSGSELTLYDVSGKLVMRHSVHSNHELLDLSMIDDGIYILNLVDNNGSVLVNYRIPVSR